MSKLSAERYQVWMPGKLVWELWLVNQKKKTAKLVDTVENAADLKFKLGGGFRVLALPAAETQSVTFYSSAINEKRLNKGAQIFLNQKNIECDLDGIGLQPIAGFPPKTLTRIDAPVEELRGAYPAKLRPDLIVPSASLLKMHRRGIAYWNELGRMVVAFEKNGLTAYYMASDSNEKEHLEEFYQSTIAKAEQLVENRVIDKIAQVRLWGISAPRTFDELGDDIDVDNSEDRPAPMNLRSSIGMRPLEIREVDSEISTKRKNRNRNLAISLTATAIILLSSAIFIFTHLQEQHQRREIERLTAESHNVQNMKSVWEEIAPAVDRNASVLEIWRKLITTPGATNVNVNRLAIARHGVILYCQADTKGLAMGYIDQVTKNKDLANYSWDYSTPEIRADGAAVFELTGMKTSIR